MKKLLFVCMITAGVVYLPACSESVFEKAPTDDAASSTVGAGQSAVQDDASAKNVVQVAVACKDHSTLVTAVKTANLVDALSNAGPFTVFAPTNEAFAQLPAGTLDDLLKPEKIDALTDILQYHVSVGVFKQDSFTDGQVIGQVNGGNITITKKDGKTYVNGTNVIVASVPASNGIIHVIDKVLLPPANK
ncbi:MAG TPA: fasciclin domain-containing protein [Sediminibacterium sp.]|nr:fasciclin domain-containing protein [Sediminibacterium sp.]